VHARILQTPNDSAAGRAFTFYFESTLSAAVSQSMLAISYQLLGHAVSLVWFVLASWQVAEKQAARCAAAAAKQHEREEAAAQLKALEAANAAAKQQRKQQQQQALVAAKQDVSATEARPASCCLQRGCMHSRGGTP
jgi:hypothetical protein